MCACMQEEARVSLGATLRSQLQSIAFIGLKHVQEAPGTYLSPVPHPSVGITSIGYHAQIFILNLGPEDQSPHELYPQIYLPTL